MRPHANGPFKYPHGGLPQLRDVVKEDELRNMLNYYRHQEWQRHRSHHRSWYQHRILRPGIR